MKNSTVIGILFGAVISAGGIKYALWLSLLKTNLIDFIFNLLLLITIFSWMKTWVEFSPGELKILNKYIGYEISIIYQEYLKDIISILLIICTFILTLLVNTFEWFLLILLIINLIAATTDSIELKKIADRIRTEIIQDSEKTFSPAVEAIYNFYFVNYYSLRHILLLFFLYIAYLITIGFNGSGILIAKIIVLLSITISELILHHWREERKKFLLQI